MTLTSKITALFTPFAALLLLFGGPARAAGLLIADGGSGGQLAIVSQDVRVTINNGIAVTRVDQVFRNTENRILEALYVFPVPQGASVANFSMWIDGKEMIGEVVEKERAREIYQSYKAQRRDPGLLEQVDYKKFEMRIFPIAPRAEQHIQIAYYQELTVDHDWATYVYPLATAPVEGLQSRTEGRFSLDVQVRSEVAITQMESPSHAKDMVTVSHDEFNYQASLEASGWDLNRDVVLAYQLKRPQTGFDLVTSKPQGEDGYLQLTLTAGDELQALTPDGMDYVFVLDISGSMANDAKLALSTASIGAFIDELDAQDRVELLAFNVQPTTLFGSLRAVDDSARQETASFLASREARGGTTLRPALETAYRYKDADRQLNVVFFSDGMTQNDERRELMALIGSRPSGTRVFCIGVGNEVNRPLLREMAEDAGGLAAFISRGDNFARQARAFRRKLSRPAASNVTIDFPDGNVYDVEPHKLANLYHGTPIRLYARFKNGGATTVRLTADVAGRPLERTVSIDLAASPGENPEIERMWAWHRISRLESEMEETGDRNGALAEIIRLGEGFSIVSKYTSFLVLENDSEYQRWKIERRNVLRLNRDRQKQGALTAQLDKMRRNAPADLGPINALKTAAETKPTKLASLPQTSDPATRQRRSRGTDVNFGGAVDPFSLLLAAFLALFAWLGVKR